MINKADVKTAAGNRRLAKKRFLFLNEVLCFVSSVALDTIFLLPTQSSFSTSIALTGDFVHHAFGKIVLRKKTHRNPKINFGLLYFFSELRQAQPLADILTTTPTKVNNDSNRISNTSNYTKN